MRTIRTKIYKFAELSEAAKEKALDNYRNKGYEPAWSAENADTLKAFANVFPVNIKNWMYGDRGEGVNFSMTCDDEIEELTGQRLATYIWNNYRTEIYKPKQYWICDGRPNCVGLNSKHRESKAQLYESAMCPLTGYCIDNNILDPVYNFINKPDPRTDFKELMNGCFESWIKACNADVEFQNSDEYISEHFEANDYEFTADGKCV